MHDTREVNIRFARNEDARGILEAHYSAVQRTGSRDYSPEICNEWSTSVTQERIIGTARVVALGGLMHGAHEPVAFRPVAFRNWLFRFLVERMGFTAIAFGSGFTESIGARSFIEGGEGDAETAARTGLSSRFSRYLENRELIQWMRDYNAAASSAGRRRIRLYGIDSVDGLR